jgi:hypothetical protein
MQQRWQQQLGSEIIKNGDAVCTIEGSVEGLSNIWNDVAQEEALRGVGSLSRIRWYLSLNK